MATEQSPTAFDPDGADLEQYVDDQLFSDSMGTLSDHTARKASLSDPRRYAVLYYLWERKELSRKEIAAAIDDAGFDLTHHLGELIDAGLIARTGAPEDRDGRQTFYRITHIGQQEIASDVQNVTGSRS